MKISIGSKEVEGPFGGGNEFLKNLKKYLIQNNHTVLNHLDDKDIDIILLTNPLIDSETSTFNNFDVDYYIKFVNPNAISFQRINECDERKGTSNVNKKLNKLNKNIDINIFVSSWLKSIFEKYSMGKKESIIIRGGPTVEVFNTKNKVFWDGERRLRIVTHHWSNNWNKGYAIYSMLDKLLIQKDLINKYELTVIGNPPKDFKLKNSKILSPLFGKNLANELKTHDIYITASLNEPSGNHHMEAALCGLPIIYINSGALPEYCKEYGLELNTADIVSTLNEMVENYEHYMHNLQNYNYTFENAAQEYLNVFSYAIKNKDKIYKKRSNISKLSVLKNSVLNKVKYYFFINYIKLRKLLGKFKA
tara:strand:- start:16482 stop:17570 length:1089 start_codon:yes stop_codon:yes gene_type:complete